MADQVRRCQAVISDKSLGIRNRQSPDAPMCLRRATVAVPVYDEHSNRLDVLYYHYYCKQHAKGVSK